MKLTDDDFYVIIELVKKLKMQVISMYKLLVVDDEYNIRDGIINAVSWDLCGVEVVGEAASGIEALKKVKEALPDIVITDISMEDMDGLELAEKLKQRYPFIKVIILSGYDEFEYAKRAVDLKVYSYLLKPILPDELIKVVREVIEEIKSEVRIKEKVVALESEIKINREAFIERLLNDLVKGNIRQSSELQARLSLLNLQMAERFYLCLILDLDGYYDLIESYGIEKVQIILQCIQEVNHDIFVKDFCIWSFIDCMGNIVVIVGTETGIKDRTLVRIHTCIDRIKQVIKNTLDVTVTVAIGGLFNNVMEVYKSYNEAIKALDFKVVAGKDCVIHIDDVRSIGGQHFSYPKDKESGILASLNGEDDSRIRSSIEAFFKDVELGSFSKDKLRISVMELFSVVASRFMDLGVDIHKMYERNLLDPYKIIDRYDTVEEIKNWLTNVVMGCVDRLRNDRSNNVKSVITKAQRFIEANYANTDISLNSIAEHVYLNPAYFSKLYKKETGETYMEFLTKLRIEKAKKLLKETNIKTSDIGTAVGYPNPQYFTTLFKKVLGITPLEYREKK